MSLLPNQKEEGCKQNKEEENEEGVFRCSVHRSRGGRNVKGRERWRKWKAFFLLLLLPRFLPISSSGERGERGLARSVAGTSQKEEKEEIGEEEEAVVGEHKLPPTSHSVCQYVCQNGGWDARGNFGVGGVGGTMVAAATTLLDRVCVVAPFSFPPIHPPPFSIPYEAAAI